MKEKPSKWALTPQRSGRQQLCHISPDTCPYSSSRKRIVLTKLPMFKCQNARRWVKYHPPTPQPDGTTAREASLLTWPGKRAIAGGANELINVKTLHWGQLANWLTADNSGLTTVSGWANVSLITLTPANKESSVLVCIYYICLASSLM